MTQFINHLIKELELDLTHETENRTETNYNGMAISICKRRLEAVKDAKYLLLIGKITKEEAEAMAAEALYD